MASSLSATLDAKLKVNTTNARTINAATERIEYALTMALASTASSSVGKATHCYHKRIAGSTTPTSIDLSPIAEPDGVGQTVTATKIKALLIKNITTTAGVTVSVGGGSGCVSTIFGNTSDILVIRPGGFVLLYAPDAAGYAVTGTSADILTITGSDDCSVDFLVITEQ